MSRFLFSTIFLMAFTVNLSAGTVSLSTDLLGNKNANLGYLEVSQTLLEGMAVGYEAMHDTTESSFWGSLAWKTLFAIPYFTVYSAESAVGLVYHEYGHYSRAVAGGSPAYMQIVHSFSANDYGDPTTGYFQLLFDVITNPRIAGAQVVVPNNIDLPDTISELDWDISVSAAGVNNEVDLGRQFAKQLFLDRSTSIFTIWAHINHKWAVTNYISSERNDTFDGGGDVSNLIRNYASKGVDVDFDELEELNFWTYILSGSTWSYYAGLYNYLLSNDVTVEAPLIGGWRIPDYSLYLMLEGPTVHAASGYHVDDQLAVLFGAETVVDGEDRTEFDLGVVVRDPETLNEWHAHAYVGTGLSMTAGYQHQVGDRLALRYQVRQFSMDTFFGLRHMPTYSGREATEIEVALRYVW